MYFNHYKMQFLKSRFEHLWYWGAFCNRCLADRSCAVRKQWASDRLPKPASHSWLHDGTSAASPCSSQETLWRPVEAGIQVLMLSGHILSDAFGYDPEHFSTKTYRTHPGRNTENSGAALSYKPQPRACHPVPGGWRVMLHGDTQAPLTGSKVTWKQ